MYETQRKGRRPEYKRRKETFGDGGAMKVENADDNDDDCDDRYVSWRTPGIRCTKLVRPVLTM